MDYIHTHTQQITRDRWKQSRRGRQWRAGAWRVRHEETKVNKHKTEEHVTTQGKRTKRQSEADNQGQGVRSQTRGDKGKQTQNRTHDNTRKIYRTGLNKTALRSCFRSLLWFRRWPLCHIRLINMHLSQCWQIVIIFWNPSGKVRSHCVVNEPVASVVSWDMAAICLSLHHFEITVLNGSKCQWRGK